ncbi:MAG: hypothetical protein CSA60_00035 [Neptuniibacter caesariensis]|uniref:Lipoprotein n=1 Tax=Neptuniibacter caesariensis TaxID=207954 RepID=A0A2G6JQ70_NEPCE|nr:MAG: hypothetical protein CSA60_00035 [Neptuniibacter caesariensis]
MFEQTKTIGLTITLILFSLLTGCMTMRTQTLDLHPEITPSRTFAKEKHVEVIPRDLRRSPVIGYRAITHEPKPKIVLKDSLDLLQHSTQHALERMGIHHFDSQEFVMEVSLLNLTYQVKKNALQQIVFLDLQLRIKVSKGNKAYTGTYTTNKQHSFLGTPSEEENETIINQIFSGTMTLAFNDNQLIDFIDVN